MRVWKFLTIAIWHIQIAAIAPSSGDSSHPLDALIFWSFGRCPKPFACQQPSWLWCFFFAIGRNPKCSPLFLSKNEWKKGTFWRPPSPPPYKREKPAQIWNPSLWPQNRAAAQISLKQKRRRRSSFYIFEKFLKICLFLENSFILWGDWVDRWLTTNSHFFTHETKGFQIG